MEGVAAIPMGGTGTVPVLEEAAIHVWILALSEGDDRDYWDCLSPDERIRAERFISVKARREYVRTRGHLRVRLGHYLGREPPDIAFAANAYGKPRLAGTEEDRGVVFNISHSGEWGLLAFARDTALGADLESVRARHDLGGLAETCLAPPELARWAGAEEDSRLAEFIRFWVCKEAFVKATGRGIGMGIKRAVVNTGFDGFQQIPVEYGESAEWRLREWPVGDFRAAVVFKGGEREIKVFTEALP